MGLAKKTEVMFMHQLLFLSCSFNLIVGNVYFLLHINDSLAYPQ